MRYQAGRAGRVFVVRFEDKDDVIENLVELAKKEDIHAASCHLVGGMREGGIVVGPETDEFPPVPVWRQLGESHEIVGFGTIFRQDGAPKVHLHGAFGKRDSVKVGCLRKDSSTFLVLEAVVIEIEGVTARRELDPETNLVLLKL